jgi:hypothetical protein
LPPKKRKKIEDPKVVRARAAKQQVRVNTDRILDAAFGDASDQSAEASQVVKED